MKIIQIWLLHQNQTRTKRIYRAWNQQKLSYFTMFSKPHQVCHNESSCTLEQVDFAVKYNAIPQAGLKHSQ